MATTEGFVRLVTDENGTDFGGTVAGAGASDLITELTVAVEGGRLAEDLALTIHPHPTLSETIMDDAEVALGLHINIVTVDTYCTHDALLRWVSNTDCLCPLF